MYMATFSGSSTVYSYEAEGRITLMSNVEEGTVSGGSGGDSGGDYGVPARILWSITYDGTNYTGGVTGNSTYNKSFVVYNTSGQPTTVYGPFTDYDLSYYYQKASNTGSLDEEFREWNNMYGDTVHLYISHLQAVAPNCVTGGITTG